MTSTIRARVRWSDGRTEEIDPRGLDTAATEVKGRGADGQWHSFYRTDGVDEEGFIVFVEQKQKTPSASN